MIGSREDAKKKVNEAKSLRLKEIHQKAYSKIQKEMKVLRTDKRANRDELATKGEEACSQMRRAKKPLQHNKGSEWQE